jgi:hypothetical protein
MLCDPSVAVVLEPGSRHDMFRGFLEQVADAARTQPGHGANRITSAGAPLPKGKKVPRANKITNSRPVIVQHYRAGGAAGTLPALRQRITCTCREYLTRQLSTVATGKPVILIWVRNSATTDASGLSRNHDAWRDSTPALLADLDALVREADCTPLFIGAALPPTWNAGRDLIGFYSEDCFREPDSIMKQLGMFLELKSARNVVGSVGLMSGGMDGPTLFVGLPAITLMHRSKVTRIADYDGVVPGYHVVKVASNTALDVTSRAEVRTRLLGMRAGT